MVQCSPRGPSGSSFWLPGLTLMVSLTTGCFSEQSFHLKSTDAVRLTGELSATRSTRQWLAAAHPQLAHLLPSKAVAPLLTDDLTDEDDAPIDVFAHFGIRRESLRSLFGNLDGIRCTAQAAGSGYHIDEPAPPWPGFEDRWIPVRDDLSLSGRLGLARQADGGTREADGIVILPGLFGDNGIKRTRDLAVALREAGFHVLALEPRGHGQTERRFPNHPFTFGVVESDELLVVSDWLEALPSVRRTGLVGFCWTANIVLLTAWFDGGAADDPIITDALRPHLTAPSAKRRYKAGIIAFSPVVRWEALVEDLEQPRSHLGDPVYAALQDIVISRKRRKNHPETSGSLRRLIEQEYERTGIGLPGGTRDGYQALRWLEHRGKPAGDKLESVRTPVLIVHGANDPLAPAQDVADLIASVDNPRVAATILPGGGHVGFAAYAPEYYFSLIVSFFDPATGAAAPVRRTARYDESRSTWITPRRTSTLYR